MLRAVCGLLPRGGGHRECWTPGFSDHSKGDLDSEHTLKRATSSTSTFQV